MSVEATVYVVNFALTLKRSFDLLGPSRLSKGIKVTLKNLIRNNVLT